MSRCCDDRLIPPWVPWSLWITVVPSAGRRPSMAMPSAFVTSAAFGDESIDQPTTRRDQASRTTQQYTLPSRVGCSVMSVTHSSFACERPKSRVTRSDEVATFATRRNLGRPVMPCRPARRINSSTALWPTAMP